MSAGILDHDRGVVWGDTWHGLPQYVRQETPVTYEQARDIANYSIQKVQLSTPDGRPVRAFALVRESGAVMVTSVGNRFQIIPNTEVLMMVDDIARETKFQYESVGTLWNGAVFFVNLVYDNYHVQGDQSETLSRIMYYNPLGRGGYRVCAHQIRVVCNNTLDLAVKGSRKTGTLATIRHTQNAKAAIPQALKWIQSAVVEANRTKEIMGRLAKIPLGSKSVSDLLAMWLPVVEIKDPMTIPMGVLRSQTIREKACSLIMTAFDEDLTMDDHTAYKLFMCFTQWLDYLSMAKSDKGARMWDGMTGVRAEKKKKAMDQMLNYLKIPVPA